MVYATIDDIETRWRPLADAEKQKAQVLLEDASLMIDTLAKRQVAPLRAKIVVCNMVARVLNAGEDVGEYTQRTQTAGSYSMSFTYAQSGNTLFISKKERELLGIGSGRMRSIEVSRGL